MYLQVFESNNHLIYKVIIYAKLILLSPLTFFFLNVKEMQGQENRKADILGIESALSNEAAELLLDEDAQVVKYY